MFTLVHNSHFMFFVLQVHSADMVYLSLVSLGLVLLPEGQIVAFCDSACPTARFLVSSEWLRNAGRRGSFA